MKKGRIFVIILTILAALCLGFSGCGGEEPEPEPPPPPAPTPTTGTLTIYNISTYTGDYIRKVVITKSGASISTTEYTVPINRGGDHSFTLEAGGYSVRVTDNSNIYYDAFVSISIGGTTNLNFDGSGLRQ